MFIDHPWVPPALIALLVILMLAVMTFFERRTRIRVYYVGAFLIGTFAIYQLYVNLSAGLDFISSTVFLFVGIATIVVCSKAATLEYQKLRDNSLIHQQDLLQDQTEPLPSKDQEETIDETEAIRDIEDKIVEKDAKQQQEQNVMNEAVLDWFNA